MWHRIITLSIAMALTGAAMAQQNDEEVKKAQAQKLDEQIRVQIQATQDRANEVARRTALVEQDARNDVEAAQHYLLEAQDRANAEQGANVRAWQRFTAARPTKREKVTYCGVSTIEPPPVLIEQLKLTRGIGLVVDFVEPGSPAEAAGIQQYDVITQLNDQKLSNSEQLGVLVRLKKPSDDANFTVIRQGQPTTINVELGQKEIEVEVENAAADRDPAAPQNRFFALRANGQLAAAPGMMGTMGAGGGSMAITNVRGNNQIVWSDDQNTLNLQLRNGKAITMTARDKAGNEIFNGPVETEEQRIALPADLGEKLKKAEAGGPLHAYGMAPRIAIRPRVLVSTEKDTLLIARIESGKATYAFAFNSTDGKTLFDGPTASDEERKAIPEAVAEQLKTLEKNPAAAPEFGVIGRN